MPKGTRYSNNKCLQGIAATTRGFVCRNLTTRTTWTCHKRESQLIVLDARWGERPKSFQSPSPQTTRRTLAQSEIASPGKAVHANISFLRRCTKNNKYNSRLP
ncbi:unnamed protein product [Ectocarpus sp. 12 AP-2014]